MNKFDNLMWRVISNIKRYIRYGIGGCIVLISFISAPVVRIRFGRIYTARIGHLCFNVDNYITARNERPGREIAIFRIDSNISNKAIFELWKKQKDVYFWNVAEYALIVIEKFWTNSDLKISYDKELHPPFSLASVKNINFELGELSNNFEKILADNKISKPYICLHNRDSAYLDHYGVDGNNHDFRDFEFEDYRLGVLKLLEMGFSVVRVGEKIKTPFLIDSKKFTSLTEKFRSDYIDVAAIAGCFFCVGGSTGFSTISRVMRKPQLLINYIPFKLGELSSWAANSIVLPKKLYKLNEKRYLKFHEMASLPYDIHYSGDFFSDLGLQVENNTPEEIADALVEMSSMMNGSWHDSITHQNLQISFWDSIKHIKYSYELNNILGMKISSTFLEKNTFLI